MYDCVGFFSILAADMDLNKRKRLFFLYKKAIKYLGERLRCVNDEYAEMIYLSNVNLHRGDTEAAMFWLEGANWHEDTEIILSRAIKIWKHKLNVFLIQCYQATR